MWIGPPEVESKQPDSTSVMSLGRECVGVGDETASHAQKDDITRCTAQTTHKQHAQVPSSSNRPPKALITCLSAQQLWREAGIAWAQHLTESTRCK